VEFRAAAAARNVPATVFAPKSRAISPSFQSHRHALAAAAGLQVNVLICREIRLPLQSINHGATIGHISFRQDVTNQWSVAISDDGAAGSAGG
jgi:hypothetical protein